MCKSIVCLLMVTLNIWLLLASVSPFCLQGTFLAYYKGFERCYPCSGISDPRVEVIDQACTPTSDAVIACIPGYFRVDRYHFGRAMDGDCLKCTNCADDGRFEMVPCRKFSNTLCADELARNG